MLRVDFQFINGFQDSGNPETSAGSDPWFLICRVRSKQDPSTSIEYIQLRPDRAKDVALVKSARQESKRFRQVPRRSGENGGSGAIRSYDPYIGQHIISEKGMSHTPR